MKYWLLFISLLLFIPNFINKHLTWLPTEPIKAELFEPSYAAGIRDMDKLEAFIDSTATADSATPGSEEYAAIISDVLRKRFYHSYSHYSLDENWTAAIAGRIVWYDLSAIVIADDILKYPMAACSQQSIVLMDFFRRKGIPFRKVGFDHHFALEAKMNNEWLYFDPNIEPDFKGEYHSLDYYLHENRLYKLYENVLPRARIPDLLANPFYGEVNEYPAKNARIFHYVTGILSHWLWAVPLCMFIVIRRKNKSAGSHSDLSLN